MSRVAELLGVRYPVIQGAMGVISNPELVSAVSNAGGYGLLATAFANDAEFVRDQVKATKELTDKPFGANLHVMNPLGQQFAEILAEEGVKAVTVSGGSPKAIIPYLHERGVKAIVVVPTVDVARKSEALGADAIVAEGSESGGMQGFKGSSTLVLVPLVVDAVDVPVIAAGGIGDLRGYRAVLALGAEGAQIGTRFIATKECVAHANYKNTIVESAETGTGLVDLGRFRIRALRTAYVDSLLNSGQAGLENLSPESIEESWIEGKLESGMLPAGEVAGLVKDIPTVNEVIQEMVT